MVSPYVDHCVVCGKEVEDYEPVYCCNGDECGCMGQPVEPCVCSRKCEDKIFGPLDRKYRGKDE